MPDDMTWRLVEPGEEISFTFDGRGRGRQNNSQEIKINQLVVRMDGWQGAKKYHPLSYKTYFSLFSDSCCKACVFARYRINSLKIKRPSLRAKHGKEFSVT